MANVLQADDIGVTAAYMQSLAHGADVNAKALQACAAQLAKAGKQGWARSSRQALPVGKVEEDAAKGYFFLTSAQSKKGLL